MSLTGLDVAIDRPLPHSQEAERAVLGSVLLNNGAWWRVSELTTDDFFKDAHRSIYSAMALLFSERCAVDLLVLREELARQGLLYQVGGSAYIASLVDGIPDIANVERYARIIRRLSRKRSLVMIGNSLLRDALDPLSEPEELADKAITALNPQAATESAQAKPLVEIVDAAFRMLEARARGEAAGKIESGYAELDFVNVFRRGALTLVGSPSNHGKTAACVNIADGLGRHGHPGVFFTLESTEAEVALRWVSKTAQVPHSRTQDFGRMQDSPSELSRLRSTSAEAGRLSLRVTRGIRTVESMYAECRRLKTLFGLDVALIDYIQIVRTQERIKDWEERLAYIAQLLLEYAIDLDISIIATSQVNKDWLGRPVHRPIDGNPKQTEIVGYDMRQEDLKRCAALSETARAVILFNRPYLVGCTRNRKGDDIHECYMDFRVAKNNENITNAYDAHFDERTQTFAMGMCSEVGCRHVAAAEKQKPMFGRNV